jgi:hypothetical protein
MDPDEALKKAREAIARYRRTLPCNDYDQLGHADALADAFEALDGWLSKGGFPPKAWSTGGSTINVELYSISGAPLLTYEPSTKLDWAASKRKPSDRRATNTHTERSGATVSARKFFVTIELSLERPTTVDDLQAATIRALNTTTFGHVGTAHVVARPLSD